MRRPEALDLHPGAVLESDEAAGVIVRRVLAPHALRRRLLWVPVAHAARPELRLRHAGDAARLRGPQEGPHRVQRVHAHVPEGATPLVIVAHVPGWNAVAPHAARTRVVQLAEQARPRLLAQVPARRPEAR